MLGKAKIAGVLFVAFVLLGVGLYDLYLYNVSIVNRYLNNSAVEGPKFVIITIPEGAGSDPRIGFSPKTVNLVIGVNNTVVWVNRDTTWHTAHSNVPEFYSNYILPGGNFTHTFLIPGIYPYHCDPHPWMVGKITVYSATTNQIEYGTKSFVAAASMKMGCAACVGWRVWVW